MNHACFNCGHGPHEAGCEELLETIWGTEPCGCSTYTKETDD